MAKRGDSVIGSVIMLILGGGFVLFWISKAAEMHAPAIFPLFGVVFLGILAVTLGGTILRTLDERSRNEAAPVRGSAARVVTKRTEIRSHGKTHSTTYYATFDLPSGERLELELSGDEYGLLAEGDRGELRYQGTWFLSFERQAGSTPPPESASGPSLVCDYCATMNPAGASKCANCGSGKLMPNEPAGRANKLASPEQL